MKTQSPYLNYIVGYMSTRKYSLRTILERSKPPSEHFRLLILAYKRVSTVVDLTQTSLLFKLFAINSQLKCVAKG